MPRRVYHRDKDTPRATDGVRELERLVAGWRPPAMIVSDNGTELTSRAMLRWAEERGIE
jgi:transposase InsO family protein